MIDLDELICGKPTWDEVVEFFKNGEFHEEKYLVEAIEKHLRTEEDRKLMFTVDLSIEKMLNGRYSTNTQEKVVNSILERWNEKLGFESFRF